jgi:hypothetical protein
MKKNFYQSSLCLVLIGASFQACIKDSSSSQEQEPTPTPTPAPAPNPAPFSVWTRILGTDAEGGTTGAYVGPFIAIDSQNNVFVSTKTDKNVPMNGGSSAVTVHQDGMYDGLLVKYDSTGTKVLWAKALGGAENLPEKQLSTAGTTTTGVAVDSSGNVYITGYTSAKTFGEGVMLTNYSGSYAAFVSKYDTDGNLKWQRLFQANDPDFLVYSGGIACKSYAQ